MLVAIGNTAGILVEMIRNNNVLLLFTCSNIPDSILVLKLYISKYHMVQFSLDRPIPGHSLYVCIKHFLHIYNWPMMENMRLEIFSLICYLSMGKKYFILRGINIRALINIWNILRSCLSQWKTWHH